MLPVSHNQVLLLCIGIYNQDEIKSSLDNVIIEIHIECALPVMFYIQFHCVVHGILIWY